MLMHTHRKTLDHAGIPLQLVHRLVRGGKYHDENLRSGYGRDSEVDAINDMEASLGTLSQDQINLRIAADFCCIWRYDYPDRVHQICEMIGGRPSRALRLHYQICPARLQELIDYAEALKGWLIEKPFEDYGATVRQTAQKVYSFLGKKDPLKALLTERTYLGLSMREINCSFWGYNSYEPLTELKPFHPQDLPDDWRKRLSLLERNIQKEMGSAAHNFLCDVGGSAEPACHFKFVRRIDILVSSIGCLKWRGNLPRKEGVISGRRQITRTYLDILENYWNGSPAELPDESEQLKNEIFDLLGAPDDLKRWLVACLWKNISNQTVFHAYPMRHWVEFVQIGERHIEQLQKIS